MMQKQLQGHHVNGCSNVYRKVSRKDGFTLVELIVVIVIMGLLTAALVPTVTGYVADAKKTVADSDKHMVTQAARLYFTDAEVNGTTLAKNEDGEITVTVAALVEAGYLSDAGEVEYKITYEELAEGSGRYHVVVSDPEVVE